jgi:hypothetical protein
LKIAFDENVPAAMVRAFQAFASERQLRKITGGFEIKSAADYAPKPGDPDYARKNDVPWLKRFAADGGKVVISGNTAMKNVPHERLALVELGFVVLFFENRWSNWKFFRKCALLLHWWPVIARTIKRAKPGFWHIPCTWPEKGTMRKVSSEDPRLLKIERKQAAAKRRKAKKPEAPKRQSDGPLFDYAQVESRDVGRAKKTSEEAEPVGAGRQRAVAPVHQKGAGD